MDESDKERFRNVFEECVGRFQKSKEQKAVPVVGKKIPANISEYIVTVNKEKEYLRHNGGRKYKVTNGERIDISGAAYSYIFDLEAELFLSDDAPIKIIANGIESAGSVLAVEGFKIIVDIEKDFGAKVKSAFISVEPWKLLEALAERLELISVKDALAMKLLEEGPLLKGDKELSSICKGQELAKEKALREDITVVWGPPGTGKTHTIAEIAIEFLQAKKTILVVSHSNVSVDGIVLKIAELLEKKKMKHFLTEGKVLRYGYVRDAKLAQDLDATSYNYALHRSPSLKAKLEEMNKKKLESERHKPTKETVEFYKEIRKIRAQLKAEEKRYVREASLVATTASKIYADKLFELEKYDVVMFDEISMAYIPQLICAASFAKHRLICVGDFKQLAPISQSGAKSVLEKDLFTFLGISDDKGEIYNHPWLVMLDEQRRMHPQISRFPSKEFYKKLLRDHESVVKSKDEIVKKAPLEGFPLSIIDLKGTYCAAGKNSDNSRYNILSAITSFSAAVLAEKSEEESIGIITPYAAQARLIRALLQDYRKEEGTKIACSTVHQFQGSERNVIIFDAVESYPSKKVGWLMSKNDNNSLSRLINVAITRAKGKLIVVANSSFWLKKFVDTKNALYMLIQYVLGHGNVVDIAGKQLTEFYKRLSPGRAVSLYINENVCRDELIDDINRAKNEILISLPDSSIKQDVAVHIFAAITAAKKRGVNCIIKVKEAERLDDEIKNEASISEKAIFPLIIIDNKILWYGYPLTQELFMEGNSGYATILHAIVRIKGENTIEMIKSLTEIENTGNEITPEGKTGISQSGLKRYITEKEFCPDCKAHFNLTRNPQTKSYYLRCSNTKCSKTKPLDLKLVQWYINQYNIVCPQHKCLLSVHNGKFGQYLHCEHGHNMKLSDI